MSDTTIKTPAFVFDYDVLEARAAHVRKLLGDDVKLCYAVKANPFLVRRLIELVDCFEVCSTGEYRICRSYGVPAEKIVLSGVYKEKSDVDEIVSQCGDKAVYTVESPSQFCLLEQVAESHGTILSVLLRLSSGNQFGMDRKTVANLIERGSRFLKIIGLQFYGGTQKKPAKILAEAEKLQDVVKELGDKLGFNCRRIEYGAGLSVNYFAAEPAVDEAESAAAALKAFGNAAEKVTEIGRFLAYDCGEYRTAVADLKTTDGVNYCIVDGGINHLNYYGQTMAMKLPFMSHERNGVEIPAGDDAIPYTVCGSLCTVADVLVRSYPVSDLRIGDTLVFKNTGAYSVTEGIYLFLSRDMPYIYSRSGGKISLLRDGIPTHTLNRITQKRR